MEHSTLCPGTDTVIRRGQGLSDPYRDALPVGSQGSWGSVLSFHGIGGLTSPMPLTASRLGNESTGCTLCRHHVAIPLATLIMKEGIGKRCVE